MTKHEGKNLLIVLSCLFIILFTFLFVKVGGKKEVNQNILSPDLSGNFHIDKKIGLWHGEKIQIPPYVFDVSESKVLSVVPRDERWVEVDISDQKLTAWEDGKIFLESLVSTGLPWFPTPTGEFNIWLKVRSTTMEGGEGKYYYNLPNVPYVMFFQNDEIPGSRGYSLHGTYWHNDFGSVHSHGCVNLPTPVAKELYYWVYPVLSNNQKSVYSSEDNLGTRVVIHE
jgi:hypothetical protein